jgi:histidine ammonia-lyase
MIAQYCAAGLVSENKVLAHPASVDSIPTSANTEDHVAMASIAARKLRTVLSNTQSALAIELMVAAQALDWRIRMHTSPKTGDPIPSDQPPATWKQVADEFTKEALETARASFKSALSHGGHAALEAIRRVVDPLCADRVLAEDIRKLRKLIEDGSLVRDVELKVGALRQVPMLISEGSNDALDRPLRRPGRPHRPAELRG